MEGTLEDKARINAAFKGAGANLLIAVTGELIGSQILMAAGVGLLLGDAGIVAYYGLKSIKVEYKHHK